MLQLRMLYFSAGQPGQLQLVGYSNWSTTRYCFTLYIKNIKYKVLNLLISLIFLLYYEQFFSAVVIFPEDSSIKLKIEILVSSEIDDVRKCVKYHICRKSSVYTDV